MNKCDCYIEIVNKVYSPLIGRVVSLPKETRCRGTKEIDVCSCNGDMTKCSFYPDMREKAKRELKSEMDSMEIEFYRDYLLRHGLVWDATREYQEWRKTHHPYKDK